MHDKSEGNKSKQQMHDRSEGNKNKKNKNKCMIRVKPLLYLHSQHHIHMHDNVISSR